MQRASATAELFSRVAAMMGAAKLPIERHLEAGGVPVLQLSMGKDSMLCLWLLQPFWDQLRVVYARTSDAYPEAIAMAERVAELPLRAFHMIETDVRADWGRNGWPAEVVPTRATAMGCMLRGAGLEETRLQPWTDCCRRNLLEPMHRAVQAMGATLLIRGSRSGEAKKGLPDGVYADVGGGELELWNPLWNWSDAQVLSWMRTHRPDWLLPSYQDGGATGLDCMHCTGWVEENASLLPWLRERHPEVAAEVERRHAVIGHEVWVGQRETANGLARGGFEPRGACRGGLVLWAMLRRPQFSQPVDRPAEEGALGEAET